MKLLFKSKDGGPESSVTGYWLIESKALFSIAVLRFDGKSREAFHSHAFNALSWVVSGGLLETFLDDTSCFHWKSLWPFLTRRTDFHQVSSVPPTSWVLTARGPWAGVWKEWIPSRNTFIELASGRRIVSETKV